MLIVLQQLSHAQILKPVKWSYKVKRLPNNEAMLMIKATLDEGWHIYSTKQKEGGPTKTTFSFSPSPAYTLVGKLTEQTPIKEHNKVFDMEVLYFKTTVLFNQRLRLKSKAAVVRGKVEFMACDNSQCLPPEEVTFSVPIK